MNKRFWIGSVLSGVIVALLLLDAAGKLLQLPPVVEGTQRLGYPAALVTALGIIELFCIVTYIVPRTSVLGAILLTGYLGGAIATHVRIGDPVLTHSLFPVYVATFVWGGLLVRNQRLLELLTAR